MLDDRQRRLSQVGDTNRAGKQVGDLRPGEFKGGRTANNFVFAGEEQAVLKTNGAFLSMTGNKSTLQPGKTLNIPVPFTHVSFAENSFNPLATQASTAAFPIPTFVPTIPVLDPDLQILLGIVSNLEALRGVTGA